MRGLSLLFARRYLFSHKSHSVINIVSIVSAVSISVPVMAMVILLSIFNGMESMITSMYGIFDPDIVITAARGKIFDQEDLSTKVASVEGIDALSYILEESVLLEYGDRQSVAIMRGVDSGYSDVTGIDTIVVQGKYQSWFGDMAQATLGRGVAYTLGMNASMARPLRIYTVGRAEFSPLFAINNYNSDQISVGGIFALDAESDSRYIFVPIEFARGLMDSDNGASTLAISLAEGASEQSVKQALQAAVGDDFEVRTRYEQNSQFYKIMNYEKWGIYFIILLVLIIASFSLVGSMTMLIIEKRRQMGTLRALGADIAFIRSIFVGEGLLVYLSGAMLGLLLGVLFCLAQQYFGFITISASTLLIDTYPVELRMGDVAGVCISFIAISYIIALVTTRLTIKSNSF